MSDLDATAVSQQATRLGLVTPEQVLDAWEELGQRGGPAEPFLRALERKGYLTPWQSGKLLKGDFEGYFLGGYRILYKVHKRRRLVEIITVWYSSREEPKI